MNSPKIKLGIMKCHAISRAWLRTILLPEARSTLLLLTDPNVDMWFIHKGRYDLNSGRSHVAADANDLRHQTRGNTIIGYSTDGFGMSGIPRENPTDMRRLAQDVSQTGLQLFGFLDHKGYIPERAEGSIPQLNIETYKAIVEEFRPLPCAKSRNRNHSSNLMKTVIRV